MYENIFLFDDLDDLDGSEYLKIEVPPSVIGKANLLEFLASAFGFPGYFGFNWDALEDCLSDLSWIEGNSKIVLIHPSDPLVGHSEDLLTYLSILSDASQALENAGGARLQVYISKSFAASIPELH